MALDIGPDPTAHYEPIVSPEAWQLMRREKEREPADLFRNFVAMHSPHEQEHTFFGAVQ